MMKNKMFRSVTNGMLLAALAAIGIAAFQLGTSTMKDTMPDEILISDVDTDGKENDNALDVGNSHVRAELEDKEEAEDTAEKETGNTVDMEPVSETELEADAEETENAESVQETAASVYHSPAEIHFSENTAMIWPVSGNLLLDYNMKQTVYFPTLDQYKCNPSISVQAQEGDPVRAAASGKVVSVSDDARTGTTVTMELGDSYQAVYGQLKDLAVSEGELVEEGTVIGYVAAPTKYYTKEGTNLYFAMKKNGEPVDPILYLP